MAKSKHVYSILIDGDISGLEKSMKSAVKTVADGYDKMAKASDKVKHLKDVVGYISQVDNALDILYKKDPDAFVKSFNNLDDGLKQVMQNLFNIEKQGLSALEGLGEKINSLNGTEGVKTMRKMAEELNSLYEVIGQAPPINMTDGLFEGKGGKDVIAKRIETLKNAYSEFALVWSDINTKIGKGLQFGNSGGVIKGGGKTIVDELKAVKKMVEAVNDFEAINLGFDATIEEADRLMKKFDELSKKRDEFIKNGDMESEDYAATYAELAKTAAQLVEIREQLSKKNIAPTQMKTVNDFIDDEDNGIEDLMEEFLQDIDELTVKVSKKLQEAMNSISNAVSGDAIEPGKMTDSIKSDTNETVSAIDYAKNVIVNAWKDYYNAVEKAQQDGIDIMSGKTSQEMDVIKDDINAKLGKWGISSSKTKNPIYWMDLSEGIIDGDYGIGDIENAINTLFKSYDISFAASAEEMMSGITASAEETSAALNSTEVKTLGVVDAFHELIAYITNSGSTPKVFFANLESGAVEADAALKNILKTLQVIDADGNLSFKSIDGGYNNFGGMVSDVFTLIAKQPKTYKHDSAAQPKLLEAQKMGANVGAILDICQTKIGNVNDAVYQLQTTVKGKGILDFDSQQVNTEFLDATDEQIKKLIQDLLILQKVGLYVDWGGDNILYDKENGFSFIDLANKSTWFTASEENSVQENLQKFFSQAFKFDKSFNDDNPFVKHVYGLMDEVVNGSVSQHQGVKQYSDAVADSVTSEATTHEQNAAAINEENKALQAQIELKKKAQSMSWESFVADESLADLKSDVGFSSLSEMESFWKKSNYDKDIDFHRIGSSEKEQIINNNIPYSLRQDWYSWEDHAAKDQLENLILANDELRNAALNNLYDIFLKHVDSTWESQYQDTESAFKAWLNTDLDVFRGDAGPAIFGEEQTLAFSFLQHIAKGFDTKLVSATRVKPKNLVGNVATTSMEDEAELFLPSDYLPYLHDTGLSFKEFYNQQFPAMQEKIDQKLVQMEKDRVAGLLGEDMIKTIEDAYLFDKDNEAFKAFSSGAIPEQLEETDSALVNAFVDKYNNLPEFQKKLLSYYMNLPSFDSTSIMSKKIKTKDVGKTGFLNVLKHDAYGAQQHLNNLTSASNYGLFGSNVDDIQAEASAHKQNANAINEENKAQQQLNQSKEGYEQTQEQLYRDMASKSSYTVKDLSDLYNKINFINNTDQETIDQGLYVDGVTGEFKAIGDIFDLITDIEDYSNTDLDYVRDFLNQVTGIQKVTSTPDTDINNLPDANSIKNKLSNILSITSDNKLYDDICQLYAGLDDISKTSQGILDDGYYQSSDTGEILEPGDLFKLVADLEQQYCLNLDYVKDYLQKAYENVQIDSSALYSSDNDDFEDELILDYDEFDNDINSEAAAHQENTAAIEAEIQAQKELNDAKAQFGAVQSQFFSQIMEFQGTKWDDFVPVWNTLGDIGVTDDDLISQGKIDDKAGNISSASELFNQIVELEQKYNEDLGYIRDYLYKVFGDKATGLSNLEDDLDEELDLDYPEVDIDNAEQELKVEQQITAEKKEQLDIDNAQSVQEDQEQQLADIQKESTELNALISDITNVENAVRAKTAAFEEEGATVSSVVQEEISSLQKLLEILQQITGQVGLITSGFNAMSANNFDDSPSKEPENTLDKQKLIDNFTKYRTEVENSGYVTDELRNKLDALNAELQSAQDPDELISWNNALKSFAVDADKARSSYAAFENEKVKEVRGELNSAFNIKNLGFGLSTDNLTAEQSEIIELRKKLLIQLDEYEAKANAGQKVEFANINATKKALLEKIQLYKEQNDLLNASGKSGKGFGATAFNSITGKVNVLKSAATSEEFKNSAQVQEQLQKMVNAYNQLAEKRKEFAKLGNLTSAQESEFNTLKTSVNDAATALKKLITESQKLKSQKANNNDYILGDDFVDNQDGRKAALEDFVRTTYGAGVEITKFKNNFTECMFAIDNGDDTITEMTAKFDKARTEIVALAGSTKEVVGPLKAFTTGIWSKFTSLGTYFAASLGWQEIWMQFKNGFKYIKEIDDALTELKKVTDATDAEYSQFLQTMSQTASVVGSTVKDLTSSAADWARLGYSLQDAGELAATTAKLLNVSEFASVDDATSALVSTLQAFTTEGQDVGQRAEEIVDILNNIGKYIA